MQKGRTATARVLTARPKAAPVPARIMVRVPKATDTATVIVPAPARVGAKVTAKALATMLRRLPLAACLHREREFVNVSARM